MGINIGTVDDRNHEANFSSQCRGRDDLRESFGFAVSITPEYFEAFTRRAEGSSSSDGRGEHTGKICAKIQIAIFGRFARAIGAMGIGNERRILSTDRKSVV